MGKNNFVRKLSMLALAVAVLGASGTSSALATETETQALPQSSGETPTSAPLPQPTPTETTPEVPTPARTPETPQAQPPQPSPIALAQASPRRGESAETLFARMDRNGDRQLSQTEFKARFKSRNRPVVYQRLPIQFRAVDTDHSGFLEAEEFEGLAMIEDAGDQAPTLSAVDTSKDARIDFREYVAMAVKLDPTKN